MSPRVQAANCGGIGAMHQMVQRLGLIEDINEDLKLLKVHLPYHESDHVLNLAYNILAGGMRLEDIEQRRQDETFLNGLDAQRIPDPTTAGDFTRRFDAADILSLQECFNRSRQAFWKLQPKGFLKEAFLDVDGTIAGTYGECKEGIGLSYLTSLGSRPIPTPNPPPAPLPVVRQPFQFCSPTLCQLCLLPNTKSKAACANK